jgi:hypothetical protein
MIIKVSQGQTIYDIASTYYGCYEGVFTLMKDNPNISMISELRAGQSLIIADEVPKLNDENQNIAQYFSNNRFKINSTFSVSEGDFDLGDFDLNDF